DANSANSNGNDSGNQENCQNQNLAIPTPRKPANNEPIVEEIVRIGFTPSIKVAQNTSNRTEKKKPQKSALEKLSNGSNETQRNSPTSKEEAEAIRQAKAASLQEQDGGGQWSFQRRRGDAQNVEFLEEHQVRLAAPVPPSHQQRIQQNLVEANELVTTAVNQTKSGQTQTRQTFYNKQTQELVPERAVH
ncbi:MAG: hypothetical protein GY740_24285, partial [Gammaproteobacteria bacterium]|nr:hypothetical protein [Gammaproteobacteria bacterium]